MLSLSDNNQADTVEVFNSTSRYLDDLLNIDNPLNQANSLGTESHYSELDLSITKDIASS